MRHGRRLALDELAMRVAALLGIGDAAEKRDGDGGDPNAHASEHVSGR